MTNTVDLHADGMLGSASSNYLLAGRVSELARLKLQSQVWEPSGRHLPNEIGNGAGMRAADIGCGVMGWLRLLSEWVGPDGQVGGTDIDESENRRGPSRYPNPMVGVGTAHNQSMYATATRTTRSLVQVAIVLLADPSGRHWESDPGSAPSLNTPAVIRMVAATRTSLVPGTDGGRIEWLASWRA